MNDNLNKQEQISTSKGKWKARMQTVLTILGFIIIFTIISMILTGVFYAWGNPGKGEEYRQMIDYTLTVTDPYGYLGGTSTNTKPYFGMEAARDLRKQVGNETFKIGELEVDFLFSLMALPERTEIGRSSQSGKVFIHPKVDEYTVSDWNQLERLPEGTVVSAYVSFSELLETREVEAMFTDREMHLLWMAVDTGVEVIRDLGWVSHPIGFPSSPIWHDDDMILESREESGSFWFGSVSESYSSPTYEEGDQEILHEQFMKTLVFLQEHESKANRLTFHSLDLEEQINYLENHGILHYGAVVTGPTKEILDLREEPFIESLLVDEVEFWNWD